MSKILERIKKEKIAVNCKSVEEAERVYEVMEADWDYGTISIAFDEYGEELCLDSFEYEGYASRQFYYKDGYQIIPSGDFLAEYDREQNDNADAEIIDMVFADKGTGKVDTVLQGYLKNLLRTQSNIANMDAPETKSMISEIIKDIAGLLPADRIQIESAYREGIFYAQQIKQKTTGGHDERAASQYFTNKFNEQK